ncbi:MAG: hypothetical protein MHM6MM_003753 [Cercozoa sp. M6MM]
MSFAAAPALQSDDLSTARQRAQWSPYEDNSGTVLAIAGKDYVILGADTRVSSGYQILTRKASKLTTINDRVVTGAGGMKAERDALHQYLHARVTMYRQQHHVDMSVTSFAQMLSTVLYSKRFFPWYTFNLVAGLDKDGEGWVFGYDAIGSFGKTKYGAKGSGSALACSMLDNQVAFLTQPQNKKDLSLPEAVDLMKDIFASIAERDIHTGDTVEIRIVTSEGVSEDSFELPKH